MSKRKVVNTASHPVDLSSGRTLSPGQGADGIEVDNDRHNKSLLESGAIRVVNPKKQPPKDEPAIVAAESDDDPRSES